MENVYTPMLDVKSFHEKYNFAVGLDLTGMKCRHPIITMLLTNMAKQLQCMSKYLEDLFDSRKDINEDDRSIRAHLMLEELAEALQALAENDEVGLCDGLGDLLYVVYGCGITFDLPLQSVFREIQRSNMTKAARNNNDTRLRDKGDQFQPPRIKDVLEAYRKTQVREDTDDAK